MTDVYVTAKGGADVTEAVAQSKARLGVEATNDVANNRNIEFVDYPFTDDNATITDHIQRVKKENPRLTVAPDVEDGMTLETAINIGDELAQHADSVIIVPKSCHPSEIPDRFRPAVATQKFGTGTPWPLWEYRECGPIHILGGSPSEQLKTGNYLRVASVDTSWFVQRARFGWWDGVSQDAPGGWDYRRRLKESLDNYVDVWGRS